MLILARDLKIFPHGNEDDLYLNDMIQIVPLDLRELDRSHARNKTSSYYIHLENRAKCSLPVQQ
jgi:hypothetical protein